MMKYTCLAKIVLTFILIPFVNFSRAQSRSSIGLAYDINKPLSNAYNFGSGVQLQGNIAIGHKFGIMPYFGYDHLNSKGGFVYVPNGLSSNRIDNVDLFHLGLSLRYYFDQHWFANAGSMFYMGEGNEDTVGIGVGGWGEAGYNLDLDEHNTFAFSFTTSIISIEYNGNGVTPIGALKLAYMFNFRKDK